MFNSFPTNRVMLPSQRIVMTNLITNGDFEASGWSGTGVSFDTTYKKFGSRSLKMTGSVSAPEVNATGQYATLNNTHKYYIGIWGYQPTGSSRAVQIYWPIAEPVTVSRPTKIGAWTLYSGIYTRSLFANGLQALRIDFDNAYSTDVMYYDGIMCIDLTNTFSAGHEPVNTSFMDALICSNAGGFFSDTISMIVYQGGAHGYI